MARYLLTGKKERRAKYSRFASALANVVQGESIGIILSMIHSDGSRDGSCFVLGKNLFQILGHFRDGGFAAFHLATLADDDVVLFLPHRVGIRVINSAVGEKEQHHRPRGWRDE